MMQAYQADLHPTSQCQKEKEEKATNASPVVFVDVADPLP